MMIMIDPAVEIKLLNEAVGHDPFSIVGFIPTFLLSSDERSAREQFNERYIAGWSPFEGFAFNKEDRSIKYPGDPAHKPLAEITFRDETILVYESAWVLVMDKDGENIEICRMD